MDEQTKLRFDQLSGALSAMSVQVQALIETHPDLDALKKAVETRAAAVSLAMQKTSAPDETAHNFQAHLGNFQELVRKEQDMRLAGFPAPRA